MAHFDRIPSLQSSLLAALLAISCVSCGGGSGGTGTPAAPAIPATPTPTPTPQPVLVAPTLSAAPASQSVAVGNPASFSVQASGSLPLSYQWQRDGVDIAGATTASYTMPVTTLDDSHGHYRVVVKNGAGNVTSAEAILTVSGISLYAGALGETGNADGTLTSARFNGANGLVLDADGNLYVADSYNSAVRKIGKDGKVSTIAGQAQGLALPIGIALDHNGNLLVSDFSVKKITPAGMVSTLFTLPVGAGDGRAAGFFYPSGVAVDANGNIFASNGAGTRRVTPANAVSIVDGVDVLDGLFGTHGIPYLGMTSDRSGNVYFAGSTGIIKVAGDGTTTKWLSNNGGAWLAQDGNGNFLRLNAQGTVLTKITPAGIESTVAGVDGQIAQVLGALPGKLQYASGLAIDAKGFVYVSSNGAILKIGLP